MAKGDVVGVAYHPALGDPDGVARLSLEVEADADGNVIREKPGDPCVWSNDAGGWCEVREATAEERAAGLAPAGIMPGRKLSKQPPQVPAVLTPEVMAKGITAKASAFIAAGHPKVAEEYLTNRAERGVLPLEQLEGIAGELGLRFVKPDHVDTVTEG